MTAQDKFTGISNQCTSANMICRQASVPKVSCSGKREMRLNMVRLQILSPLLPKSKNDSFDDDLSNVDSMGLALAY